MSVVYLIPIALLYQASEFLQPPEQLYFVTGFRLGPRLIVLTQLVEVKSVATRVHVTPNAASVLRAHQLLLAMGLEVEAIFHSHPGRGKEATRPSPEDIDTARRWENGCPFLGGIFSECGRFVRFFNHQQKSQVIIYGQHIETIEPNCFELPQLLLPTLQTKENQPDGLVVDRPTGTNSLVGSAEDPGGDYPFDWSGWAW